MTMMKDQQKTFDKLRRIPFAEMLDKLTNMKMPPPLIQVGGKILERHSFYKDTSKFFDQLRLLAENGWDFEEFALELEKKTIRDLVDECNNSISFPQEMLDRAKVFFPNVCFTPAKITLE